MVVMRLESANRGGNNSGRMAVFRSIWAMSSAPWSAATGKDSATSVPLISTMRESLSKTSRVGVIGDARICPPT